MLHSLKQNYINSLLSPEWNIHDSSCCSIGSKSLCPYSNYPTNSLTYTHTSMDTDTDTETQTTITNKECWRTAPLQSIHIFLYEVQHPQQRRVLFHCLQSHQALPRLLVEGRTSKGGRENERGHFSLGPGVKLTGGLWVLWTSHGSLICCIAGQQSRTDWMKTGRRVRLVMETETKHYIVKLKERSSRQIKSGNATFMQVTSNIPFNLFLTTEESLWNIDGKERSLEVFH